LRFQKISKILIILLAGCTYGDIRSFALYAQAPTNSSVIADIEIGSKPETPIPANFMGFSHEWGTAQLMMGDSNHAVNAAYRQLLCNLTAYGSGPIVLRIGGNSTDKTTLPAPDALKPFAEIYQQLGVHFDLSINLGSRDVQLARNQASFYLNRMPLGSIDGIEIGNEPDAYAINGMRSKTYTALDYIAEFNTWKMSIENMIPTGVKVLGPSWSGIKPLSEYKAFIYNALDNRTVFSQHFYLGNARDHHYPDDLLLAPNSAISGPRAVERSLQNNNGAVIPFRMLEINSLAGGGQKGVSDAFSSALWAIDTMFEYAKVKGIEGVNWHTGGGAIYSAFDFRQTTNQGKYTYTLASVRPLYYGLLVFQKTVGSHAQLLPVGLKTNADLKAWAVMDLTSSMRLIVINKEKTEGGIVRVKAQGYRHATIERLEAPSYTSTDHITFGGQTFDGSTDGSIKGHHISENIISENIQGTDGSFQFQVPASSAALVIFAR
jgi:hypothetical protein